jgi:hypothetical protein
MQVAPRHCHYITKLFFVNPIFSLASNYFSSRTVLPATGRTKEGKGMKKEKAPNFTETQEARIRDTAPHNAESAALLADEFGKSPRSVIAKIVRMGVEYARKQPTTKTGDPVISKAKLVEQISAVVEGNLDGLDKAPKPALVALARFATASASE